jgi:hypothetical protein
MNRDEKLWESVRVQVREDYTDMDRRMALAWVSHANAQALLELDGRVRELESEGMWLKVIRAVKDIPEFHKALDMDAIKRKAGIVDDTCPSSAAWPPKPGDVLRVVVARVSSSNPDHVWIALPGGEMAAATPGENTVYWLPRRAFVEGREP